MKKLLAAICVLLAGIIFVGCGEQSFDSVPYTTNFNDAPTISAALESYNAARLSNQQLLTAAAEYTTEQVVTDHGVTTKTTTITKIGSKSKGAYIQITNITYGENGEQFYTTTTWYNGIQYDEDVNGNISTGTYSTDNNNLLLSQNFSALLPTAFIVQNFDIGYTKSFSNTSYYKLCIASSLNSSLSFINKQIGFPDSSPYINFFNYEFGVNTKGYLQMFRTYYKAVDRTQATVYIYESTTTLTSYGSSDMLPPDPV